MTEFVEKELKKEKAEAEARDKAEAERLEALKPEVEKVRKLFNEVKGLKIPELETEEGISLTKSVEADLFSAIKKMEKFIK